MSHCVPVSLVWSILFMERVDILNSTSFFCIWSHCVHLRFLALHARTFIRLIVPCYRIKYMDIRCWNSDRGVIHLPYIQFWFKWYLDNNEKFATKFSQTQNPTSSGSTCHIISLTKAVMVYSSLDKRFLWNFSNASIKCRFSIETQYS